MRKALTIAAEIAGIVGALIALIVSLRSCGPAAVGVENRPDSGATSQIDPCGAAQPCRSTDSATRPCGVTATLQEWGLDPKLDALLIEVGESEGGCTVRPAPVAAAAGAGAEAIEQADSGDVPDVLRKCARASGAPIVPCSEPHEVEFVGDELLLTDGSNFDEQCRVKGREYTASTLNFGSDMRSGVLEDRSGDSATCVLVSNVAGISESARAVN
jgi:hypothetical protein